MLNLKETTNKTNIIIALALTAFIIISYMFTPYSKSFGVEVENPSRKMIALTFDDGPSDYTQALLDGLKSKNAKATFFVLGKKAQKNTETIKNIIADGHLLGNHTYSHIDMMKNSKNTIASQIYSTNKIIKEITGTDVKFYRPPYGHYFGTTLNKAHDGEILLLHDTKETTVKAALRAIDVLQAQGYSFVRVDELLCRNGDKLAPGIAYRGCKFNKRPTWF